MKKFTKSLLIGLCALVGLSVGGVATGALSAQDDVKTAYAASTYTTKDVAMLGSIAGWHGNGNFEIRLTLGECDWASETGQKAYAGTEKFPDLPSLLQDLDLFNYIKVGDKTLAQWGCTTCYENSYWLNQSEPKYTLTLPLAMGADNMAAATAAGVGSNSRLTILEGALIPSYAYLQGDTSATVYRAGCDFVTESSDVAYGVLAYAKTEVESIKYVTGWDATYNNAYLGVSLKGDDYLGDGTQAERHPDYYSSVYTDNQFTNKITVDGVAGKTESYGLFNLGEKGQGYFSFVIRAKAEDTESITIPAGTLFPSRAMRTLFDAYGNPVYIMYQTQTDVTFYRQADGSFKTPYVDKQTDVTSAKVSGDEADNFTILTLTNHDYPVELDNYGGTAVSTKDILAGSNFYTHVLIDGVPLGSTGEAYVNVWGNKGVFAFRAANGVSASKITVLAGCQIPSYAELSTGKAERFVTTKDVSFVKNENGEWVQEVAPDNEYLENAKTELDGYKAGLFRAAEEAQRAAIVENAKASLNPSMGESEIDAVVAEAKSAIDKLKTAAQYADEELADVKAAARLEIENYKADAVYFEEQAAARAQAIEDGRAEIAAATTEAKIAETVETYKGVIDGIPTKTQYVASAKETLDGYKSEAGYFKETEEAKRAEIVASAKESIDQATTATAISEAVTQAQRAIDRLLAAAEYYKAKDVAMEGRIGGWYGNGNFTLKITLGYADWTNENGGEKTYDGDLALLLDKLGFFEHIVVGGKTLAEWGCKACYDNGYELNNNEPDSLFMFHLSMGSENMAAATAAGVGSNSRLTILEGALIPSYGYLTHTSDEVYRAGCDYVTISSNKAYGIEAVGKTAVESVKYVQGHDGTCGYFGISFVGDDYLGDGTQLEINQNYYYENKFTDLVLVNGERGKVGYYGLFNLGENGVGYYAFQIFATEEELVSITIPAGTLFPTRAMTDLYVVNGNPVYIMYEVETEITLYKTANGYGTYLDVTAETLMAYKAGLFREAEETQRTQIISQAIENMQGLDDAGIDAIVAEAMLAIDGLKTAAQYADEELAGDKQAAIAEMEAYKADVIYLAEQAQVRADAILAGKEGVASATTVEEIAAAVSEAKGVIDTLIGKAVFVSSAIADVESYKADVEYLVEQAAEKTAIITTAKATIESASSQAEIDEAVANAKAAIDALKSKTEIESDVLASQKAAADEKVNALKKAIDFDLYEEDVIETINGLYEMVKETIDNATSEEEINKAVEAFERALAEAPKKKAASDKGGCASIVETLSCGIVLLGVAAAVLFKKKEN